MSCPFYNSNPSYYGYCSAKSELERRAAHRQRTYDSDGYISHREYRCYDCSAGNTKYKNCPYYRNV